MKKKLHLLILLITICGYGQTPIYQFNFDGNANNSGTATVTTPFATGATYVNGRNGDSNGAIACPNNYAAAVCPSLPVGNSARTLSCWVQLFRTSQNNNPIPTRIIGWGNNANGQAFGLDLSSSATAPFTNLNFYFWGSANDLIQSYSVVDSQWIHLAFVYDGVNASTYLNGTLLGTQPRTINTVAPGGINKLVLGKYAGDVAGGIPTFNMDDLKIYDTALSASQILSLYNNNASVNQPVISNVSSTAPTPDSITIMYEVNPGGASTIASISVTGFGDGIGSVYESPAIIGNTTQSLSYTITGLMPGKCYSYSVQANNSAGSSAPSTTKAFCTLNEDFKKTPVYHFEFNGNTQDKNDPSVAFTNPNSGFVDNNTAIRLNNNVQSVNLPYLAQGANLRTVAVRVLFESGALAQENNVFSYGSAVNNQSFGYNQTNAAQGAHYYWGSNDIGFNNPVNFGTYYTMVFVYEGMDILVYKDGVQVAMGSFTPNTIGTMFRLGRTTTGVGGYFNGRIDDLRIYNDALNSSDVSDLHLTLSGEKFESGNLKFSFFPNPAAEVLKIEMTTAIKSVAIYSLQGQEMLTGTAAEINVAHLASGMYFVKVQDAQGNTATQKLMIQ